MREMRDEISTEMRRRCDEVTGTLRADMHKMRDELSRNAAILTESVRDDIRIVWTSPQLPSPPVVIRKDLPLEMRADMEKLFLRLKDHDMKLAESVAQGRTNGMVRVYHEDYALMCQAAVDEREARRKR
jgi:ABC-type phosphate/phosphonate transport system substrate-binding protein